MITKDWLIRASPFLYELLCVGAKQLNSRVLPYKKKKVTVQ